MSTNIKLESEDMYFKKQELDLLRQQKKAKDEAEKKRLKEQHWMRCPKCGMELGVVKKQGIEVDICSECNGIWFDAGEFEDLVKAELEGRGGLFKKIKDMF